MPRRKLFFQYAGKTPIIPISAKILAVFICLLLLSNFTTNFINVQLNQSQIIRLTNQILVNQLKDLYTNASNQFEIYKYSQDQDSAVSAMKNSIAKTLVYKDSVALAVRPDASLLFCQKSGTKFPGFVDLEALDTLNQNLTEGVTEGSIIFSANGESYLGVYKYHEDWKVFLIRAETLSDLHRDSNRVFLLVTAIIIVLTVLFLFVGLLMFKNILRNIRTMTESLYKMQSSQKMDLLDLSGAPNDDITYLGASFNALSSTINNLLAIFQKFVSQDVVEKAYSDHIIHLEGTQRELTILFSDIRGFTYMTETLGNDIINLLNIHYDRTIKTIHEQYGVIGSIIGDAVLAVYGTMNTFDNKSLQSVRSAWSITQVTAELRRKMIERREQIEETRSLTEAEERVYKAVLLDVGVGIDGGKVFYGNIGSSEHMTNTVIGDNVNSASRLEGLTRIYKLPVIISEYIKNEIEKVSLQYKIYEIDTVQVKGKTEGKKIFFPLDTTLYCKEDISKYDIFAQGLTAYYQGDWKSARQHMKATGLEVSQVFLERMGNKSAPEDWSGIWTMTTK